MMSPKQAARLERRDKRRQRELLRLAEAVGRAEERAEAADFRAGLTPKDRRRWRWERALLRRELRAEGWPIVIPRGLRRVATGLLP